MSATVVVAAMGFVSTLLGAWLAVHWQHRGTRELRILDAKVRTYGDCAATLYEYERATFNRAKARLDRRPEDQRDELRQEVYRCNAKAQSAIGQAAFLSANETLRERLEAVREKIGDLTKAVDNADLKLRHEAVYDALHDVLASARSDLTR